MKKILTLLLFLPLLASAQLKITEMTVSTTGVDGDIFVKVDSGGGSGSNKSMTMRAIKAAYNIAADSLGLNQFSATTSAELAGVVSDETGTGVMVYSVSPTLTTPNLGTPSTLVGTNITGTASGLSIGGNAATVTTNANLTGGVTSVGNAATVVTNANLTGGVTSVGNATTVITNANLTGEVTSVGNATTLGSFTSSSLLGALSDETGTGISVFSVSPALTGTPTAPTAAPATNTTQIATTAFVLANAAADGNGIYDGSGTIPTTAVSTLTDTWTVTGGQVTFKGSGATAGTTSLLVENSAGTDALEIKDDLSSTFGGVVTVNAGSGEFYPLNLYKPIATAGQSVYTKFSLNNSAAAEAQYAGIGGYIVSNTAGSESGGLYFAGVNSGSAFVRATMDNLGNWGLGVAPSTDKLKVLGTTLLTSTGGNTLKIEGAGVHDIDFNCTNTGASQLNYQSQGVDRWKVGTGGSLYGNEYYVYNAKAGSTGYPFQIDETTNEVTIGSTASLASLGYKLGVSGSVGIVSGDFTMATAGDHISIASGANTRAGNATLVAGTVTVANTSVTANTIVLLTKKTDGGTIGTITYTLSAATSFTITSDSGTDTSTYSYLLIENP